MEAEDLFNYTFGRWVYNEPLRQSERYVSFNIQELKRVAAESINKKAEDVVSFKKLAEGGFNRIFQIGLCDGVQLIARIPYHITVPKQFATASEVATMDFLRSHAIPVPKVLAYSARSDNAVGVEYLIMEMVMGKNIGDYWYEMSEEERLKIIFQIARIEGQLFSIPLPANGSIYYTHDLDSSIQRIELPDTGAHGRFCIGPSTQMALWYKERSSLSVDRGPFTAPDDAFKAGAKKERAFLTKYGRDRHPEKRLEREVFGYCAQSPLPYLEDLESFLAIASHVTPKNDSFLSRPTIRHPDLNPNNVMVSESFDVVALIDWQHCSVLPLFLQAAIPAYFQNYGDDQSESLIRPQLPENMDELDSRQQAEALEIYQKRHLHYWYVAATVKHNGIHWEALWEDTTLLRQKVCDHASRPWQGENVTLKADLIDVVQRWSELAAPAEDGSIPPCPIAYSEAEARKYLGLRRRIMEMDEHLENMQEMLGLGSNGWVPCERIDACIALNAKTKGLALEMAESDFERRMLDRHWPFDNQDEEE